MVSIADGLEGGQSSFTTTTSGPVSNAAQPPLFRARFSPKFRPISAMFRPFSPTWRQEAGQRKGTAEKRRKTGEKRPRNSGLGGVGIPGVSGMLTVSSVLPAEEISIEDGPTLKVCDQSENCANL